MIFAEVDKFDWAAAWKTASIVLTGAFGVLGLLTEFTRKVKNNETGEETRVVTRWGYISLAGIVISTIFGAAAQIKETQSDGEKALKLAQQSADTLAAIDLAQSPIEGSSLYLSLRTTCAKEIKPLCDQARAQFVNGLRALKDDELRLPNNRLKYDVVIFSTREDMEAGLYGYARPKITFFQTDKATIHAVSMTNDDTLTLYIRDAAEVAGPNAGIRSIRELPGRFVLVAGELDGRHIDTPAELVIRSRIGEVVSCNKFDTVQVPNRNVVYRFCVLTKKIE